MIALAKGLELVWRNENKTKRDILEWTVGAVLDTASSSLNTHWSQEYIYKQTPEWKELCLLKTTIQYLKVDAAAIKKIEALYSCMMSKEINVIEQDSNKNEKIIDLNQFKKNKKPNVIFKNSIVEYLESIFYEKHFHVFGTILRNKYTLVLTDFFSTDEIKQLVECVKKSVKKN